MARIFRFFSILAIVTAALIFTSALDARITGSTTYNQSAGGTKLIAWDDTDPEGGARTRYTYGTSYEIYKPGCSMGKSHADWNTYFFINYSNSSSNPITDSDGKCYIRFDSDNDSAYEAWAAMNYNATSKLWEYNRSFTYKGSLLWQGNCTSSAYDNLTATDNVTISNTYPCIFPKDPSGYIPSITCTEDQSCTYNFALNVTEDDTNDVLTYACSTDCFTGFSINPSTGLWTTLVANDLDSGQKHPVLRVMDSSSGSDTVTQNITINAVNDAPVFGDIPSGATQDIPFPDTDIVATDEENNLPFNFSINITGCNKASWVTGALRNNCTLFNTNQTTSSSITILGFLPTNLDVGAYTVNYSVTDSPGQGFSNSTRSEIRTFTVANVNDLPNMTSWNSTSITVNQSDILYLLFNGTDPDNDTLTFNITTLYLNLTTYTNPNLFTIAKNDSKYPGEPAYGIVNMTMLDQHVGNFSLNITVTDNGTGPDNLSAYIIMNLTVNNVNDPPALENLSIMNLTAVQEVLSYFEFNATDPDFLSITVENLTFRMNLTWCQTPLGGLNCNSFDAGTSFYIVKTDAARAALYVNASRNDTGNYTMNLSVTDSCGLSNWTLINISVIPDWAPSIYLPAVIPYMIQNQSYFFSFNVTDPENDTLTINYFLLYNNYTNYPVNNFPIAVNSSAYPPYYNLSMNYSSVNNSQVGNYTIEVDAKDIFNRITTVFFNITVFNLNDPPEISNFTSCYNPSMVFPLSLGLFEDVQNCYRLRDPDPDLSTPYGDILSYSFDLLDCTTTTGLPPGSYCAGVISLFFESQAGFLNFTAPDDSWQGNYSYNLTITDAAGLQDSKIINISIGAVNDPPRVLSLLLENASSPGENITYALPYGGVIEMREGSGYNITVIASDEEGNVPLYYNASFTSCQLALGGGDCQLFSLNSTTGFANFTPNASWVGNYTVNITVTDSGNSTKPYNATGYSAVNISVLKFQNPPIISVLSCGSCNSLEGSPYTLWYNATDMDNESLVCEWYMWHPYSLVWELRYTVNNCNTTNTTAWPFTPSYDDSLNYTKMERLLMLKAIDPVGKTANKTLKINVTNVNRPPRFEVNITPLIQWGSGTSISVIELNNNFKDDYGESLNYTYNGSTNVNVLIDADGKVTLTPIGNWFGEDWIIFTANDSQYTNESNNVTLIVNYTPPIEVPVRIPTPPVTIQRPKVASLRIVVPKIVEITGNHSLATVILSNTGEYDLFNISLSSFINSTDINISLMDDYLGSLPIGRNFTTYLDIFTSKRIAANQTYLAQILANVTTPYLRESGFITMKFRERNEEEEARNIIMIKDMFEENPECMELFSLILKAEDQLKEGNIDEARRLTKLARDNCQDMIDYAKVRRNQTNPNVPSPEGFRIVSDPIFIMGLAVAMLALAMAGFWMMARSRAVRTPYY